MKPVVFSRWRVTGPVVRSVMRGGGRIEQTGNGNGWPFRRLD
jgi:hypothetical protein